MSIRALRAAIDAIDIAGETPFLVLGWNDSKDGVGGGTYPIHEDMAEELLAIAVASLESLPNLEMRDYAGATLIERGEEGLWVSRDQMHVDSPLLQLLLRPDALPILTLEEVELKALAFSAIGFGARAKDRTFFFRRRAQQLRTKTRILANLAVENLRPITTSNIISIERGVDFILRPEGAIVFETSAFEKYVQEPADATEEHNRHVDELALQLSADDDTLEVLKRLGSKMTYRGRLRSIRESDYYLNLTIKKVKAELKRLQLSVNDYVKNDRLSFGIDEAPLFLRVLDDAAWRGGFSGTLFSTDGKRNEGK